MTSNLFLVFLSNFHLCDDRKHNNCFLSNCTDKNYRRNILHLAIISNCLHKVALVRCRIHISLFSNLFICTKIFYSQEINLYRNMNKEAHKYINS